MMYTESNGTKDIRTDEELCFSAQGGDRAAEETLVMRYFCTVKSCARPYFLAGADGEDLIQEGMMGLIKAVRSYSSEKNVPFSAFARMCIMRRIYSAVRSAASAKHEPLNHSESIAEHPLLGENPDAASAASRTASDPVALVIGMEEQRELRQQLSRLLSAFEAQVLTLYLDGRSYEEMAHELGRPVKAVDNAIQRIRRKAATLFPGERR